MHAVRALYYASQTSSFFLERQAGCLGRLRGPPLLRRRLLASHNAAQLLPLRRPVIGRDKPVPANPRLHKRSRSLPWWIRRRDCVLDRLLGTTSCYVRALVVCYSCVARRAKEKKSKCSCIYEARERVVVRKGAL